jgi:hypothetical protein
MAARMKALERENRELRQANDDRCPLRGVLGTVIQDHPDGALAHLRRELPGRCVILHGSNLSGSGASGKRGAVHLLIDAKH